MPCVEWFSEQDVTYRDQVLPPHIQARVSVEAGIALGWQQFVGAAGRSVSLEHFGASADTRSCMKNSASRLTAWPRQPGTAWPMFGPAKYIGNPARQQ